MATVLQVLTDAHAAGMPEGYQADRKLAALAPQELRQILEHGANRGDLNGVVDLGDLIEHTSRAHSGNAAELDAHNLASTLRLFDTVKIPHIHAIGNHPLMNLSEEAILGLLRLERPFYECDLGDHKVVVLHSRFSHKVDSIGHKSGSGIYIDDEQLTWLKNTLERAEKNVLVCCHHPLSDQDLSDNAWFNEHPECALTENRDAVQGILANSGKVIAVMNGHTHWNHLATDRFGIPHITLQSLSENFRGDGSPAGTYGIATLKDASFNVEVFGRDLALRNATQDSDQIARDLATTYNSIAQQYADSTAQFGGPEQEVFKEIEGMLIPDHKKVVVDFGCGPGRDIPFYVGRGFQAIGVDVSSKLLEIARLRSPNQQFIEGSFASAPLERNSAAIVIHSSTLQHVPRESLDAVLRKAYDTLEPGGVFYAHYRSGVGESLSISTEYKKPIARFIALYTEAEMEAAMKRVGFEIIKSVTFDHKYEGLKGQTVKYKTRTWARKPAN